MNEYTTPLIKQAAKYAFTSDEARNSNFVLVVDMGMNEFSVIDYDETYNALIPTVVDITEGSVYIVDRKLKITEFS
jgi:hypothetical protein